MIKIIEKRKMETRHGTPYEVWEWICPECNEIRSTLYIDGEWCHGDGKVASNPNWKERCVKCWGNEKYAKEALNVE